MAPKMKALRVVGVPYTDDEIKSRHDVKGKTEMDALVAYLQVLARPAVKARTSRPAWTMGSDPVHRDHVLNLVPAVRAAFDRGSSTAVRRPGRAMNLREKNGFHQQRLVDLRRRRRHRRPGGLPGAADHGQPAQVMARTTPPANVWDEDLREMNNPLPRWWMGLFVITVCVRGPPGSIGSGGFGGPARLNQHRRSAIRPGRPRPAAIAPCTPVHQPGPRGRPGSAGDGDR